MILRRLALTAALAAVVAVSGGIVTVALILSLVSLMAPALGWAWAAAVTGLIIAAPLAVAALVLALVARKGRTDKPKGVADFVSERPLAALAVALAVGVLASLRPRYVGSAARVLLAARLFGGA